MAATANPFQSLNAATAAGAGSVAQPMGGSQTASTATTAAQMCRHSVHATLSGWSANFNVNQNASPPQVSVQLQVSHDNSNWVNFGPPINFYGNGTQFQQVVDCPATYLRLNIPGPIDGRITAFTINGWIGHGA